MYVETSCKMETRTRHEPVNGPSYRSSLCFGCSYFNHKSCWCAISI